MLMRVIAHRGSANTVRVCTESWFWEKNSLQHQGEEFVSSSSTQDLTLHQLSYPPPPPRPPQNVVQQVGGNKETGGGQRFNTKKFNSLEMS